MSEISDEDISLIMHSRKTLLFSEGIPWVKRREIRILMFRWVASMDQRYVNQSAVTY